MTAPKPTEPREGVVVTDAPLAGTGPAVNDTTGEVTAPGDPLPPVPPEPAPEGTPKATPVDVAGALADIAAANPSVVTDTPAGDVDPDPPVYDERGNVRPRGTPGAKPMTKAERVKIAARLRDGEQIVTTSERKPRKS